MTVESSTRKVTTAVGGMAILFAAVFWLLDAGSEIVLSNAGISSAVLPPGNAFVSRVLFALVFGLGGAIAGAAWERSRAIESLAMERLRDGHRRYQALLASSFDSVMTLDRDGRIVNVIDAEGTILYASPSSRVLTGLSPEEQIGLRLFRSVHPDDREAVLATIAAGFERPGRPQRFTCRVYRHDGAVRCLESVGTAFMTRRGVLRAVVHSRDITDRLETDAQLRKEGLARRVRKLLDQ